MAFVEQNSTLSENESRKRPSEASNTSSGNMFTPVYHENLRESFLMEV